MVDKITSPITSIELINKTNEIIDNLGSSSGVSYTATCPAITPVDGVATWVVTHSLGTQAVVTALYSNNDKVEHNTLITSNNALTVTFKASSNVTAGSYKIVVLDSGGTGGGGADVNLSNITDTAKVNIANVSLPSGTYEELTIGADGTTYTAPADGWYYLDVNRSTTATGYFAVSLYNSTLGYGVGGSLTDNYENFKFLLPVKKGNVVSLSYQRYITPYRLTFYYANGSESEAS